MDIPQEILAAIGIAVLIGALAVFFKKGGDKEASALDKNTIRAYRDSEVVMNKRISFLEGQVNSRDDIIAMRDKTIERLLKK